MHAAAAESICYATTNRQEAVKETAAGADLFLVVGAPNSSNSMRLVEVAERAGAKMSLLVQRASEIPWDRIGKIETLGLSAGASAPEIIVDEIIDAFRERFDVTVDLAVTATETENFPVMRAIARRRTHQGRHGLRQRLRTHGGLHRRFRRRARDLPAGISCGKAALLQGHRRGFGKLELPAPHLGRLLHPDPLRKARPHGRSAFLSRPDAPSRRARASPARCRSSATTASCSARSPAARPR